MNSHTTMKDQTIQFGDLLADNEYSTYKKNVILTMVMIQPEK
jgi:hypothetical protein